MSAGGSFRFTRVHQGLFTTRGLSRNSESSRLLTHQNALRFRLRSSNISSDGLPSSTAHTGQTGARGPSGQSVLVLLGSREQCLEFPLIGTKRTSLRHVAAYNVSRMSAFRVKRTPHESAIGTHRTLLLGNARLYRSADGSGMLIHTLWISRLSRGTCSRSRIP